MQECLVQAWLESEAGWGCRPDGYSIHLNAEDCKHYIEAYWERMPGRDPAGKPPHEYSRPEGEPAWCEVSDELFEQVKQSKNGIRLWSHDGEIVREKSRTIFRAKVPPPNPADLQEKAIDELFSNVKLTVLKEKWPSVIRWEYQVRRPALREIVILFNVDKMSITVKSSYTEDSVAMNLKELETLILKFQ